MAGEERLLAGCDDCPMMLVRDLGCWEWGGSGGGGKGK